MMPKPSKGTEFCKLLLSQASKDMRETLVPMAIPALTAHLSEVEFMYSDNKYYELCGQMGHLMGPSGIGKAQLNSLIEAIQRSFRDHDEIEYKRLADWIRMKASNLQPRRIKPSASQRQIFNHAAADIQPESVKP